MTPTFFFFNFFFYQKPGFRLCLSLVFSHESMGEQRILESETSCLQFSRNSIHTEFFIAWQSLTKWKLVCALWHLWWLYNHPGCPLRTHRVLLCARSGACPSCGHGNTSTAIWKLFLALPTKRWLHVSQAQQWKSEDFLPRQGGYCKRQRNRKNRNDSFPERWGKRGRWEEEVDSRRRRWCCSLLILKSVFPDSGDHSRRSEVLVWVCDPGKVYSSITCARWKYHLQRIVVRI